MIRRILLESRATRNIGRQRALSAVRSLKRATKDEQHGRVSSVTARATSRRSRSSCESIARIAAYMPFDFVARLESWYVAHQLLDRR